MPHGGVCEVVFPEDPDIETRSAAAPFTPECSGGMTLGLLVKCGCSPTEQHFVRRLECVSGDQVKLGVRPLADLSPRSTDNPLRRQPSKEQDHMGKSRRDRFLV